MTPAAELKEEFMQLRATRLAPLVANLTLLLEAADGACPRLLSGDNTMNAGHSKKSKASAVASVEMPQLSMKAWCALN